MRLHRDYAIGLVTSAVAHFGILFGVSAPPPPRPTVESPPVVEVDKWRLPPEDPPKPEKYRDEDDPPVKPVPHRQDIPVIDPVSPFVQPAIPPPPKGEIDIGARIPPIHPENLYRERSNVFDRHDLDQQPQPRVQPAPIYPHEMRSHGIEGEVEVGFICTRGGNAVEP